MALASTQTQLETVQTAIAAIEGGAQSYSISGRSLTRADLPSLYKRERELLSRLEAEGSSLVNRSMFTRGRAK